jgi:hypothetical protein
MPSSSFSNSRNISRAITFGAINLLLAISFASAGYAADKWAGITPVASPTHVVVAEDIPESPMRAAAVRALSDERGLIGAWQQIKLAKVKPKIISVTLTYNPQYGGAAVSARSDAETLVKDLALALQAAGFPPATDRISIFVHAQQPIEGVTGADRVLLFGMASYDYNDDSIEYDAQ